MKNGTEIYKENLPTIQNINDATDNSFNLNNQLMAVDLKNQKMNQETIINVKMCEYSDFTKTDIDHSKKGNNEYSYLKKRFTPSKSLEVNINKKEYEDEKLDYLPKTDNNVSKIKHTSLQGTTSR